MPPRRCTKRGRVEKDLKEAARRRAGRNDGTGRTSGKIQRFHYTRGGVRRKTVERGKSAVAGTENLLDAPDRVGEIVLFPLFKPEIDLLLRGGDGAVAPAAEMAPDLGEGAAGVPARQPHRQHPRVTAGPRTAPAAQLFGGNAEDAGDRVFDLFESNRHLPAGGQRIENG